MFGWGGSVQMYNSLRVEKKMSEGRREKRFKRKPAERKDDLCGP